MRVTAKTHFRLAAIATLAPLFLALVCAAAPKKPVLAFYTEWDPPGGINYSKVTHILFAFSTAAGGGSISSYVPGGIVSSAHSAGVKVLASIGGVNNSSAFPGIAGSASSRTAFANNIKSLLNGNNLDGVDIDWEFPEGATDSANFASLLREIRKAIGTKLITIDVAADGDKALWVSKTAAAIPDFINVMSYDYTGDFPGSLVGQHSPYTKATTSLSTWRIKSGDRARVILGVPFYGKDFNAGGAPVAYKSIMANNPGLSPDADSVGRTWFNGVTTMKKKASYVAANGYGGVMLWQMAQDASGSKSLLDAIVEGLTTPLYVMDSRAVRGAAERSHLSIALPGDILPGGRMINLLGRGHAAFPAAAAIGAYILVPETAR
jgi:chitinase